jgi:hypothetical protein
MPTHYIDPSKPAGNTRSRGKDGWGKQHVHMDEAYHRATRKYNASKRKIKAYNKAHGIKAGTRRRHRKSRSTRRR